MLSFQSLLSHRISPHGAFFRTMLYGCVAMFAPLVAVAEIWLKDTAFAPVLESSALTNSLHPIAAAPGGKVFVGPYYPFDSINGVLTPLSRLNADGSIDATFNPPAGSPLTPLAVYPDGRILVSSGSGDPESGRVDLIRLLPSGQIDASFSKVTVVPSPSSFSVHLLADGRVLLVGFLGSIGGSQGLCLLNPDGTVVSSFHASLAIGTRYFSLRSSPLTDGRVIVYGDVQPVGGASSRRVARVSADGSIDPTFSIDLSPFTSSPFDRVFPQIDGRLLVFFSLPNPGLARFEADGRVDTTFPFQRFNPPDARPLSIVSAGPQQPDGKILITSADISYQFALSRINPDGTPDPSFQVSGYVWPISPSNDGTLFVGAAVSEARQRARALVTHLLSNGTIDPNFNPRLSSSARIDALAFQADGKVVIAGAFDYAAGVRVGGKYSLARFTADGRVDSSFNATLADTDKITVIQPQPDGGWVAAGSFDTGGTARSFARFKSDGSRDLSFVLPDTEGSHFKVDAFGRIYAVRSEGNAFRLERFLSDGRSDLSFAGIALPVPAFAIWPDGSGVVAALVPNEAPRMVYTLARFSSSGALDPSYSIDHSNLPQALLDVVAIPGGSIVALGNTELYAHKLSYVRFAATGAADYIFQTDSSLGSTLPDVAGILFDALRDAGAPSTSRVRADLGAGYTVEVNAAGRAGTLTGDYYGSPPSQVTLYQRTAVAGPSVRAAPAVLAVYHSNLAEAVNLGGTAQLGVNATGLLPLSYQWKKYGVPVPGATAPTLTLTNFTASDVGSYTVEVSNPYGSVSSGSLDVAANTQWAPPSIPDSYGPGTRIQKAGESLSLVAQILGNPLPTPTWYFNGRPITSGASVRVNRTDAWATLEIENVQPADAGIYLLSLVSSVSSFVGPPMVIGISSSEKSLGTAAQVGTDIRHPNGNIYDQLLLTGGAASITADPGQVARTSFVDFNGDIVQVEFAGAGTLSLVLDSPSTPAPPVNYNQPNVSYVTGQARIVVVNADESTHLSIFSVGRANAIDQTLFREGVNYDGMADIACVAISSRNGKFGGLLCGNTSFSAPNGFTGVYAPNTRITGPMYIGDISAFDAAQPVLIVGAGSTETWITGGNVLQSNGRSVRVEGLTGIKFTEGTDSHGRPQPRQLNAGKFEQSGTDVTSSLVRQ